MLNQFLVASYNTVSDNCACFFLLGVVTDLNPCVSTAAALAPAEIVPLRPTDEQMARQAALAIVPNSFSEETFDAAATAQCHDARPHGDAENSKKRKSSSGGCDE